MYYDLRRAYQEAADTSSACDTVRQKLGCIIMRHLLRITVMIAASQRPAGAHHAEPQRTRRARSRYSSPAHRRRGPSAHSAHSHMRPMLGPCSATLYVYSSHSSRTPFVL
jgi:hypothetical protein